MKVSLELQPCCGKRSGIGTYVYELARRLETQNGIEFCGNLFNFCDRNDNSDSLRDVVIPIHENHLFPYGIYRRLWHVAPLSYRSMFPEKADLNVFFNFIVPPRVEGAVMTTVHDLTYLRYPETMDGRNLRRINRDIRYSIERSSRILTDSEFSKKEIKELLHVPAERIAVVYAAPPVLSDAVDFTQVSVKYKIEKPYILYVGTIEPRKNLVRLIEAFDSLKQKEKIPHQLVLAGGDGWSNSEIYKAACGASHSRDIIFTGYVSAAEKTTLYQYADAFVFPSLYEGFGIPPLEAMSQNCPVICANAASLPEVVGDAAIFADPLNTADIAEGILRVLTDAAVRDALIEKGTEQFKKFNWQASADRFTDVCKEVLKNR